MGTGIPEADMEELEKLKPGDMVFAKLGPYPWWPATIALCFQPKHKNLFRLGTEPSKSKFWVQFFNENSGAFVPFRNTRIFRPDEANRYLTRPGANLHDKQKVAIEMALQDYSILIDGEPQNASSVPGAAAPRTPAKATTAASKGAPQSEVDDGLPDGGTRKRRRSSELDRSRHDGPPAKSLRRTSAAGIVTEDECSDIENGENLPSSTVIYPSVGAAGGARRISKKSNGQPKSRITADVEEVQAQLEALRRLVEEKDRELISKEKHVQKLLQKIDKLRKDQNPEKVRILLPMIPKDVPVVMPSQVHRPSQEMSLEQFIGNVSKLKTYFETFERDCLRASTADDKMTTAARESLDRLRPLHAVVKDASKAVLSSELKVGDILKRLFAVKISAKHLTESNVGKLLNRIARRSETNSNLIKTLSTALRASWLDLLQEVDSSGVDKSPTLHEESAPDSANPSSSNVHHIKDAGNGNDPVRVETPGRAEGAEDQSVRSPAEFQDASSDLKGSRATGDHEKSSADLEESD